MRYLLLLILLLAIIWVKAGKEPVFKSAISPLPDSIKSLMRQHTWHEGCPVSMEQLAYIELSYWGFDNQPHQGQLIVHQELAKEVVSLFKAMYHHRFPLQSMQLMDAFNGDDNASMLANNTSGFNCREVTGRPGEYSQHSYGRAIDINPLMNPYVTNKKVIPASAAIYVPRHDRAPGKIRKGDWLYQLFTKYGWDWGGNWYDVQDYQHFEKRAHGEKRNPHGYGK